MIAPPVQQVEIQQAPILTEAGASTLAEAAVNAAQDEGIKVAVSVVDAGGHLIVFRRMDGVPFVSVDVAIGKARTAAAIAAPSAMFEKMINGGAPAMLSAPGLVPLGGGMPVLRGGLVAGAVGISGGRGEQDALVAENAVAAFDAASGRQ